MDSFPTPRKRTRSAPIKLTSASTTAAPPVDKAEWRSRISYQPLSALTPATRQIRRRAKDDVATLASNIAKFGVVGAVIVSGDNEIIVGHGIFEACKQLGLETIPTIVADHLNKNEERALRLALNKLSERSVWDLEALAAEFSELFSVAPDLINFTGFKMPEVDAVLAKFQATFESLDKDDGAQELHGPIVTRPGDIWIVDGGHKLLCGNARDRGSYKLLLGEEKVQMVFSDPPYPCPIRGHVSRKHDDFIEGSNLNEDEAFDFFKSFLLPMVAHLSSGAIVDLFIDWRGLHPLVAAAVKTGLTQICHCVWDKGAGAMGSLYRHQVEHILIFKWGRAPHINNVQLGRHGRNRTTVWSSPGLAQFGRGRKQTLDMHPTVKPVGLVVEALLDTSKMDCLVLDPFAGSGTTLLAAHRCRRIGRGIELDPRYVDVAIRRFKDAGLSTRLAETGETFEEVAEKRAESCTDAAASTVPLHVL